MPTILILDNIADEGIRLLEAEDGFEVEVRPGLSGAELHDALMSADGAICRSGVQIDESALKDNRRLKVIARAGVGTDNIDKKAATRQGVVVMNTPTGNTFSTAEHTFALLLGLSRNIAPAHSSLINGSWDRKGYLGNQVADKILGIVGLGRIGQEVAKRAQAFQMHVMGYDPFLTTDQAAKLGIELMTSVDEMLPHVDYLTVHTPLTPETENLVGDDEIQSMKSGARLINCARGGIYNEDALLRGLESGKLAGVALDVFKEEPCTESPLFSHPAVLCTPHLGASTEEAQTRVAVEAVHLLVNYFKTGEIRHSVNIGAVDPATLKSLRGYLNLAHRTGVFLSQWSSGGIERCKLEFRGNIANEDTRLLTSAFCAGLLQRVLEGEVNIVNAQVLLRDRGIQLAEHHDSEMGAFSSSLTISVGTDETEWVAGGTIFGNDMPRLIRLDNMILETYLDGTMLVFTHQDTPGIIGALGTILGEYNINIAQMSVGRAATDAPGGLSIGVLNLDSCPSEEAIQAINAHEGIHQSAVIEMPPAGELPSWLL